MNYSCISFNYFSLSLIVIIYFLRPPSTAYTKSARRVKLSVGSKNIRIKANTSQKDKSIFHKDRKSMHADMNSHYKSLAYPLMQKSKSRLKVVILLITMYRNSVQTRFKTSIVLFISTRLTRLTSHVILICSNF